MYIKNLLLENFRNYENEEFSLCEDINIFYGDNAQGKTNAVEGIFFLCTGYSPRAKRDKQFIYYGKNSSFIKVIAQTRYGETSVSANFFSDSNKVVKINDVQINKIGEIYGNINAVYFNPQELKLVTDSPEDRRRFIDIALSQIKKSYFYALQKYKKIILQRNNLLKNPDRSIISDTLAVWDMQLAPVASKIIYDRNEFLKSLAPFAKEIHAYLTDGAEDLSVGFDLEITGTQSEIEAKFLQKLKDNFEKDVELGYTSFGPHRDDLKLNINGREVKVYGSQGQMRTTALSLKLAEIEIFKSRFLEPPILILDDALSELDKSRQKKLLQKIKGVQTIITCTHIEEDVFENTVNKRFLIKGGKRV